MLTLISNAFKASFILFSSSLELLNNDIKESDDEYMLFKISSKDCLNSKNSLLDETFLTRLSKYSNLSITAPEPCSSLLEIIVFRLAMISTEASIFSARLSIL